MKTLFVITILGSFIILPAKLRAQQVKMVDRNWIDDMNADESDTVYVINFWATWCKPCVEELPYFEKLSQTYRNHKVKVLLVSCDFKKQVDSRLVPFIREKNLHSQVLFMNESNPVLWIDKVDPEFSGAIPATLILKGSKKFRHFEEGETTYETLDSIVKPLID
jgi:thiol-disulfide isomerase/thioredoxin